MRNGQVERNPSSPPGSIWTSANTRGRSRNAGRGERRSGALRQAPIPSNQPVSSHTSTPPRCPCSGPRSSTSGASPTSRSSATTRSARPSKPPNPSGKAVPSKAKGASLIPRAAQTSPPLHRPQHDAPSADAGHRPAAVDPDALLHAPDPDPEPVYPRRQGQGHTKRFQDVEGTTQLAASPKRVDLGLVADPLAVQLPIASARRQPARREEGELVEGRRAQPWKWPVFDTTLWHCVHRMEDQPGLGPIGDSSGAHQNVDVELRARAPELYVQLLLQYQAHYDRLFLSPDARTRATRAKSTLCDRDGV